MRAWEERLLPLAESLAPVAPPARVWAAIQSRIRGRASTEGTRGNVWSNLALWRGLTLAGFATALALALVVLTPPREAPSETMVAVLAGQDAKPVLVASADRAGRILTVKAIAPLQPGADRGRGTALGRARSPHGAPSCSCSWWPGLSVTAGRR